MKPVIKEGEIPDDNANAVQVKSYPAPNDKSKRIAAITWVYQSDERAFSFKKIIDRKEMGYEDAMIIAQDFVEKNNIPEIYVVRR